MVLFNTIMIFFCEVFVLCWRQSLEGRGIALRCPDAAARRPYQDQFHDPPSLAGRGRFREVHGPTKVIESHDTRADSSNAASFVHELSFTAAPSQHGLVEQNLRATFN
jgi:hypothetical protein